MLLSSWNGPPSQKIVKKVSFNNFETGSQSTKFFLVNGAGNRPDVGLLHVSKQTYIFLKETREPTFRAPESPSSERIKEIIMILAWFVD